MRYIYLSNTQSHRKGDVVEMAPDAERTQALLRRGIVAEQRETKVVEPAETKVVEPTEIKRKKPRKKVAQDDPVSEPESRTSADD